MNEKDWVLLEEALPAEKVADLSKEFKVSKTFVRLLMNRNLSSKEEIKEFLFPSLEGLCDPYLMSDMEIAVERILKAKALSEKITVYGDYDVDGVTATAVLVDFLRSEGMTVDYYIPDRYAEGDGLNCEALCSIIEKGTKLLITVDCGITAVEEIAFATGRGLDVIITDHHECKDILPAAQAIVNPKREGCAYPFKELAGVGVAFKLVFALAGKEREQEMIARYSDLFAVGTIADVMPLFHENRALVKTGLDAIRNKPRMGLAALFASAGIEKKINSSVIGFSVSPRINAAGRMGGAACAAELMLTSNPEFAKETAMLLCEKNLQRQMTENEIMKEALEIIDKDCKFANMPILVVWNDHWHYGVIGIVASRISEKFNKPCILISFDGDSGKGSGRSLKGFNLYKAIEGEKELLERFGGHELAAGITISRENAEIFREKINEHARECLKNVEIKQVLSIECEPEIEDIDLSVAVEIETLEPFGMGNPIPLFLIRGMEITEIAPISAGKHMRFTLQKEEKVLNAFYFGMPQSACQFVKSDIVDVVCNFDINTYRGKKTLQLLIRDMRLCGEKLLETAYYRELYQKYKDNILEDSEKKEITPNRSEFVAVYRFLKMSSEDGQLEANPEILIRKINWHGKTSINYAELMVSLEIFREMGLLTFEDLDKDNVFIKLNSVSEKVNLDLSKILKSLRTKSE